MNGLDIEQNENRQYFIEEVLVVVCEVGLSCSNIEILFQVCVAMLTSDQLFFSFAK